MSIRSPRAALLAAITIVLTAAVADTAMAQTVAPRADLAVESAAPAKLSGGVTEDVQPGAPVTVSARAVNHGPVGAKRVVAQVSLRRDVAADVLAFATELGRERTRLAGAGTGSARRAIEVAGHVPGDAKPGSYRVTVCLDPDDTVRESDEDNNCLVLPDRLEVAPPASAALLTSPASPLQFPDARPGAQSTATATFMNAGGRTTERLEPTRIDGDALGDFTVVADGCHGQALDPHEGCAVTVRFAPQPGPLRRDATLRAGAPGAAAEGLLMVARAPRA